ncbi:unnamed protein product, partial [Brenthis ino]
MVKIVIAGIPKNLKLLKILSFLNTLVEDLMINASLTKTHYNNDNTKQITLVVRAADAPRLRKAVDGHLYRYGGRDFPLECWQESVEEQKMAKSSKLSNAMIKDAEYLNNPTAALNDELQAIDHKIELVRKQRFLIEEESKLLLEKKKLEILKNIGVNDVEKLKKFEEIKDRNNPAEIADLAIEVEMPNVQSKKATNKLPNFYGPCKALFAEMKDVIQKYVNPDNKAILLPLIRSTIKKRLVVVLKGKKFLVVQDILQVYRATYPTTTDEQMLQSLVATISQSCWPKSGKNDEGQQRETETIATDAQEKQGDKETENSNLSIIDLTRDELMNTSQESGVNESKIIDPVEVDDIDLDNDLDDWEEDNMVAETMNEESTKKTVEESAEVQVEEKISEKESGTEEMEIKKIENEDVVMEEKNNEEDDVKMVEKEVEKDAKINDSKVVEINDQ